MNFFRRFSTMSLKEFGDVPQEVAIVGEWRNSLETLQNSERF